jgi:hypothetical protein
MTTHGYVTPQHVALMMDWVKTARLLNDIRHDDSWIDKCGYSALGGEFTEREKTISKRLDKILGKSNDK